MRKLRDAIDRFHAYDVTVQERSVRTFIDDWEDVS